MQIPLAFISKNCFNMKYSERTRAHFARVMRTMATRYFFSAKGHKLVEILALLNTKLSSYKTYKVGMLFCVLWALI